MSESKSVVFKKYQEYELTSTKEKQLAKLLALCFSEYPSDKTFLKQVPSFRLLAMTGRKIIGQIAVDYRQIKVGEETSKVFCLSDVCVDPMFQSQKIASKMLQLLEKEGVKFGLDFLLLTASENSLYYRNGYRVKNNVFRWLMIQDSKCLGINQRRLEKTVMVKRLGKQRWSNDVIDLGGVIF